MQRLLPATVEAVVRLGRADGAANTCAGTDDSLADLPIIFATPIPSPHDYYNL